MLDDGNDLARRKPVRRTVAERSAIVAETYRPGATVAGVARRHGIVASQLSSWRTIAKGKTDQDKRRGSGFAEITVEANDLHVRFDGIEVVCGAVVIRLPKSTTPKRVADIARHVARGAGRVIYPSQAVRIVIATKPVDFRKGHDGLAALTERELGLDPHSGIMVVFRAKRGDRIKVLLWDGSGLVLCYKRLEHGKFAWPKVQDGMMRLTKAQFEALFEGLDWRRVMARRTRRPGATE